MFDAPEFASVVVSKPSRNGRIVARVRALIAVTALYGAGLAALIIVPLLILENVDPPKASPIIFRPLSPGGGGSVQPKGGGKGGGGHPPQTKHVKPPMSQPTPQAVSPDPLPTPVDDVDGAQTGSDLDGEDGPAGPIGIGDGPPGIGDGHCLECPAGPGPEGPGEEPYYEGTPNLIPPTLIPESRALPKYPDMARRAGLQGSVILLVVVRKDGTVGEIEVLRSPDQRWGFDLSSIEAVKQWRYHPALMNGQPVATFLQVLVEYSLAR